MLNPKKISNFILTIICLNSLNELLIIPFAMNLQ